MPNSENLKSYSTEDLILELRSRTLINEDGLVAPEVYTLLTSLGARPCVDGVALRRNEAGELEGSVIRRKSGKFPGKLALVGGNIALKESIEHALRRHYRTDLGVEIEFPIGWDQCAYLAQYAPKQDGANLPAFSEDPTKHSVASTHIVRITSDLNSLVFGKTTYGGQEAMGLEWYTLKDVPPEGDWSYNMRDLFIKVLTKAQKQVAQGELAM